MRILADNSEIKKNTTLKVRHHFYLWGGKLPDHIVEGTLKPFSKISKEELRGPVDPGVADSPHLHSLRQRSKRLVADGPGAPGIILCVRIPPHDVAPLPEAVGPTPVFPNAQWTPERLDLLRRGRPLTTFLNHPRLWKCVKIFWGQKHQRSWAGITITKSLKVAYIPLTPPAMSTNGGSLTNSQKPKRVTPPPLSPERRHTFEINAKYLRWNRAVNSLEVACDPPTPPTRSNCGSRWATNKGLKGAFRKPPPTKDDSDNPPPHPPSTRAPCNGPDTAPPPPPDNPRVRTSA